MNIDRQRRDAVTKLLELGYKWDGTTWESDASVGIMFTQTYPIQPAPQPPGATTGAAAGLLTALNRLRIELASHAVYAPPIPGFLIGAVAVEGSVLSQVNAALRRDASAPPLYSTPPVHPTIKHGLFALDGVQFISL